MLKRWICIWSMLVFVFATIAAPLHAHNMTSGNVASPVTTHVAASQAMNDMPGMMGDTACQHSAAKKASKEAMPVHSKGCCSDGCQCPLSHCPASPGLLVLLQQPLLLSVGGTRVGLMAEAKLTDQWNDRLKRPPRT